MYIPMPPSISIIIPACNEEKYIEKTLHSLEQQQFRDFEVIVVANGCTDQTEEVVKQNANPYLRLLSLPQPNVSVARNAGALNAQGKILLFLDADTQLASNSLQIISQQFTAGYAIAGTKVLPDIRRWDYTSFTGLKNIYLSLHLYPGCSGALICQKDDFHSVGGYDPTLKVREHYYLSRKLTHRGKYKCLNTKVITSMRRYQHWGMGKALSFWMKQWVKDIFPGLKNTEYEKIR